MSTIINPASNKTQITVNIEAQVDGEDQDSDYRVVLMTGSTLAITATLTDSTGATVDLTEDFAMPIEGLDGQKGRSLLFEFTDGVASKSIEWPESGEWQVTEEALNRYIRTNRYFKFAGLYITVAE